MAKSPSPVRLTSHTKLQLWDGRQTVDKIENFVDGPVKVPWTSKDFRWWFDYTTKAPGFAGHARWEISRTPFVDWADWKPTEGYGYAGVADGTRFRMDLKPYAPIPGSLATTGKVGLPADATLSQPKPANASPTSDVLDQFNPPKPGTSAKPATSGKPGTAGATAKKGAPQPPAGGTGPALAAEHLPVDLPTLQSLYVRVVPLDSNGADADLPSNFVELKFGPPEKAPPFNVDPPVWPQIKFLWSEYRPVQGYTFDWQCYEKAAQDIATDYTGKVISYHKGDVVNTCQRDSDPVSAVMNAFAAAVELLKKVVNDVSAAFNGIKGFAISKIAGAVGCSEQWCKTMIATGLNAGLVGLGMPPELPDFDALQAMGEDYLAETIAQQVASQTGVQFADDLTKEAVKQMIDKGKEAAASGGGDVSWMPDDGHQYKRLLVMVEASNPATANSASMNLEITETSKRYKDATVKIPALQPNQSIKIGIEFDAVKDPKAWMALLPATSGSIMDALAGEKIQQQAKAALDAWRAEYLSGTVTFRARLTQPPFVGKQVFEQSCLADEAKCIVAK